MTERDGNGYFYFTRHGQTFWNVDNKICGSTDIGLTQQGRMQARALGEKILEEGLVIDGILSSPLSRARDTAQAVSDVTGIPIRVEPRLTEQNFGYFEGTPRDGADFLLAKRDFICRYGCGESMLQVSHRIYSLLDEIRKETGQTGKVYLLVAHNGIARMVESYFHDMTNEEFAQFHFRNCEIRKYSF